MLKPQIQGEDSPAAIPTDLLNSEYFRKLEVTEIMTLAN